MLLQGVVTPALIVTACSAALAPLYNWLLVDKLHMGLAGAALANDAVQVISAATAHHVCEGSCTTVPAGQASQDAWSSSGHSVQLAAKQSCWCLTTCSGMPHGGPDSWQCTCRQTFS